MACVKLIATRRRTPLVTWQVVKRQLLELGDEEFLAETGTIVSQTTYHQSVIRINTKLVYAQVSGAGGALYSLQSIAQAPGPRAGRPCRIYCCVHAGNAADSLHGLR